MYDVKETDASFTEASAPINSIICPAYPVNSNEFFCLPVVRPFQLNMAEKQVNKNARL